MNGYVRVQFYAKDLLDKFVLTPKNQVGRIVGHGTNNVVVQFKKTERLSHLWLVSLSDLRGWKVFDDEESAIEAQKE